MIQPFFVVWNPDHGLPRMQHLDHEAAKAEAKRLAEQNPGERFFVLGVTGCAVRQEPVEWIEADTIPF